MKNNMDYFKTMNEKDLDLTKTAVDWTDSGCKSLYHYKPTQRI